MTHPAACPFCGGEKVNAAQPEIQLRDARLNPDGSYTIGEADQLSDFSGPAMFFCHGCGSEYPCPDGVVEHFDEKLTVDYEVEGYVPPRAGDTRYVGATVTWKATAEIPYAVQDHQHLDNAAAVRLMNEISGVFQMHAEDWRPEGCLRKWTGRSLGRYDDGYSMIADVMERWQFRPAASAGDWPMHVFAWRTVDPARWDPEPTRPTVWRTLEGPGEGGIFVYMVLEYLEGAMTLYVFDTAEATKAFIRSNTPELEDA